MVYDSMAEKSSNRNLQMAMLWVLNYSDGKNSLLDISLKANMDFSIIHEAAEVLVKVNLVEEIE